MGEPLRNHWLPEAALEVSVTEAPAQNVVGPPGVMVGVGGVGFTVTTVAADAALEQPDVVTMTVELPDAVGLFVLAVAPAMGEPPRYHWLPDALLEVSVTEPPAQNVVGPPGVMVGVAGIGFTVTGVAVDEALGQPETVTPTVYFPVAVTLYVLDVAPP